MYNFSFSSKGLHERTRLLMFSKTRSYKHHSVYHIFPLFWSLKKAVLWKSRFEWKMNFSPYDFLIDLYFYEFCFGMINFIYECAIIGMCWVEQSPVSKGDLPVHNGFSLFNIVRHKGTKAFHLRFLRILRWLVGTSWRRRGFAQENVS